MIKASAPRESGGYSWVLLSIVLVGAFPLSVWSQPAKKENAPAAAAGAAAPAAAAAAENKELPTPVAETYVDPRAEKCLANTFPTLGKAGRGNVLAGQVKQMAAGQAPVDRATVDQFVQDCIHSLTDRNNIKALIDPDAGINPNAAAQTAIQTATDNLIEPILVARGNNNTGFSSTYNQSLLLTLPPLLENQLMARIAASIVLAQTGVPEAVDIFVKQLNNREQTVWVQLWAARGLTNVQQITRYNLDGARAIKAAKAVTDFLDAEKELPWPVQYRALEALGSLRLSSTPQMTRGQPEMAGTATQFLTDPDGRIEVRAEAGWALSMMVVPAGIKDYNFTLLAYSVGEIAAQLGGRIREVYSKNPTQAFAWTGVLVTQIYQTFDGIDAARDSGLLKSPHPAAIQARPFAKQVSDKTKPLAAAAVKLIREPAGRAAGNLKDLEGKIADLKALLQKNPPANTRLVPNGPQFKVAVPQVANAPAAPAQVVNRPPAPPAR